MDAPWGQQRRLEFIDFRLYWEGRLNRSDLIDHFGISFPQASLDLAHYQKLAPNNITYDRRKKIYRARSNFAPVLAPEHSDSYLSQLLTIASGSLSKDAVFIGWAPPTEVPRAPRSSLDPAVLVSLLRSIQQGLTLSITYQTRSHPEPVPSLISPHAIAFDGFQWYARAYSDTKRQFLNLSLRRLVTANIGVKSSVDPHLDRDWSTIVEATVTVRSDLPEAERRVLALEYGMPEGAMVFRARAALLPSLIRQLGLHVGSTGVESAHFRLSNAHRLEAYLKSSASDP